MNNIGVRLDILGNKSDAISWFEKAVQCDPDSQKYKNNLAATKRELAELQQQESNESQCESLFQSGLAKGKAGDKPGAVAYYNKVLSLCPNHCTSMNNIGAALDDLGKKSEAIPWFEKASACNPGNALYKKNITATKQEIAAQNFSSTMSSLSSALSGASGTSGSGGHYSGSLSGGASGQVRLTITGSSVRGEVDGTYKGSRFTGMLSGSMDGNGNIRCKLDGKVERYAFSGEFTGRVSAGSATGSWNAQNKYGSPTGSWRAGRN
jgi:tetratricopeptide (TPR) repeat protein